MRKTAATEEIDDAVDDATALRAVPDLGGAPVVDASGIHVGALVGALAEAESGLLRYIDLALDTLDRHVLIPIGHARVLEQERAQPQVRLRAALLEQLEQVPPFPADVAHITDPFERALLEAYGRTFHGERYYAHPAYDHDGLYVGPHPVVGPEEAERAGLAPLSALPEWRVASGEADIRGWRLQLDDRDDRAVADLIVDTEAETVRYAVIDVPETSSTRLLPIGYLRIDRPNQLVHATGLRDEDLRALPSYDGAVVTRAHEDLLTHALRARLTGQRRYQLADFRRDEGAGTHPV